MKGGNKKRILVRTPNWVGDAVMTLPALESLKRLYGGSEITLLAKKKVIPIYERNPAVKGIIEYGEDFKGLAGRFRLSGRLRTKKFQLAVLFQNAFDAAFISFISRIPERAGYSRDMRGGLLTIPVRFSDEVKRLHHVFYYLRIIEALGGSRYGEAAPKIYLSEGERLDAKEFLREKGLGGAPLIGASPGASYGPAKMWPPERFARVLIRLSGELGAVPIVFGGPDDIEASEKVFEMVEKERPGGLNLAGKISLRRFMALASMLRLFIANDSGPMHIAAALGLPTVAIFGSTDPRLTGPQGGNVRVLIKDTSCSPCFERKCRYGHYRCLTSITAEEVYSEAAELLSRVEDYEV